MGGGSGQFILLFSCLFSTFLFFSREMILGCNICPTNCAGNPDNAASGHTQVRPTGKGGKWPGVV
ncbi:uncharacterized protein BDW47DRAFT_102910 [Aspergillus candidus]|uniref:Uncharacterized protein n=1 Tax=Aspergillus candidus TaxID=41067 RepID=A0A2I2FGD3_ASPCN|nr:hypothetical protein BDW47DRAFT_102910 [Aspergillus candidus]PLB39683.1 hypothetical protein BDW47DRAFT_102910 [Aspergillus candidus]